MIRINLLPFRAARTKENVRRQISVFVLIIILMLVGMFAFTIKLNTDKTFWQGKVADVKAELARYTKHAKEVDKLKKEAGTLQKKIDIIASLEDVRREPVMLFTALTDVIVAERMHLESFDISGSKIKIKGRALDEITVADFTKRLEISEAFTNVALKFLKSGKSKTIALKDFEINCSVGKINKDKIDITTKGVK